MISLTLFSLVKIQHLQSTLTRQNCIGLNELVHVMSGAVYDFIDVSDVISPS